MSPASMEPEHCNKKGIADDDGDRSKEEVHKHTRRYMGIGGGGGRGGGANPAYFFGNCGLIAIL